MKSIGYRCRPLVVLSAMLASIAAGCVAPPPGHRGDQYQSPQPPPPQNTSVDPTGRWCFKDSKGKNNLNYIELVQGGIIASPIGRRGAEAFYSQVGPNLYQHKNGATYEFYNFEQGVWRRGNRVWPHQRCG